MHPAVFDRAGQPWNAPFQRAEPVMMLQWLHVCNLPQLPGALSVGQITKGVCLLVANAVAAVSGDEHGRLLWPQGQWQVPAELPPLGTKLLLQPGHCDPTVNLYDCVVAFRNDQVVGVWPVARGPGL